MAADAILGFKLVRQVYQHALAGARKAFQQATFLLWFELPYSIETRKISRIRPILWHRERVE